MTRFERKAATAGNAGRFSEDSSSSDDSDHGSYYDVESESDREEEVNYGDDDGDYNNGDDEPALSEQSSTGSFSFRRALEEQSENEDEYSSSLYSSSSEEIVGHSSGEIGMDFDSSGNLTPTSGSVLSEEPQRQRQRNKSSNPSPSKSTSRTMLVSDSEESPLSDRVSVARSYDDCEDGSFYDSDEDSRSNSNSNSTNKNDTKAADVNGDSGDSGESFGVGSFSHSSFEWSSFGVNNENNDDINNGIGVDEKDVDVEHDDGEEGDDGFAMFVDKKDSANVETGGNPKVLDVGGRNIHVADAFGIDLFAGSNSKRGGGVDTRDGFSPHQAFPAGNTPQRSELDDTDNSANIAFVGDCINQTNPNRTSAEGLVPTSVDDTRSSYSTQASSNTSDGSDSVSEPIRGNSQSSRDNDCDDSHDDDDKSTLTGDEQSESLSSSSSVVVCDVAAEMMATATVEESHKFGQNGKNVHQSSASSWNYSYTEGSGSETHDSSFSIPSPLSKSNNFNHHDDNNYTNSNLTPIHDRSDESEEESPMSSHNDSSLSLYYKTNRLPPIRDESEEESAISSRHNSSFSSHSEKLKTGTANNSSSNNDSFAGLATESHRRNACNSDINEKSSENKTHDQNDSTWNASFGGDLGPSHPLSRNDVELSSHSPSSMHERADGEELQSTKIEHLESSSHSEDPQERFTPDNINFNNDSFTKESVDDFSSQSLASTQKKSSLFGQERSDPLSNGGLDDERSSSSKMSSDDDGPSSRSSESKSLVDRETENDSSSSSPSNTDRLSHRSGFSAGSLRDKEAEKPKDSQVFSFQASFNSETFQNKKTDEQSPMSSRNDSNPSQLNPPINDASPFLNSNNSSFHTFEFSEPHRKEAMKKQPSSSSMYPTTENNTESHNFEVGGESSWNPVFDNKTSNQEADEVSPCNSASTIQEDKTELSVSSFSDTNLENFKQPDQGKVHNDEVDESSSWSSSVEKKDHAQTLPFQEGESENDSSVGSTNSCSKSKSLKNAPQHSVVDSSYNSVSKASSEDKFVDSFYDESSHNSELSRSQQHEPKEQHLYKRSKQSDRSKEERSLIDDSVSAEKNPEVHSSESSSASRLDGSRTSPFEMATGTDPPSNPPTGSWQASFQEMPVLDQSKPTLEKVEEDSVSSSQRSSSSSADSLDQYSQTSGSRNKTDDASIASQSASSVPDRLKDSSKPVSSPEEEPHVIDDDHSFYSSSGSRQSDSKHGADVDESWNSSSDGSPLEVSDPNSVFDSYELAKSLREYPDQFSHASSVEKSRSIRDAGVDEAKKEGWIPNFSDDVDEDSTSVVSHEEHEEVKVSVTSLYSSEHSDLNSFADDADESPLIQKTKLAKNKNTTDPLSLNPNFKTLEAAGESDMSGNQMEQSISLQDSKMSTVRTAKSDEMNIDSTSSKHGDQNGIGEYPDSDFTKASASKENTVSDSRTTLGSISELHISVPDATVSTSKNPQVLGKKHKTISDNLARGEDSEASMRIGDVFGQPNELFDDYQRSSLKNSSRNTGNISGKIGSKYNSILSSSNTGDQGFYDNLSEESQDKLASGRETGNGDGKQKKGKQVISEKERRRRKKRKKEQRKRKKEAKSPALLDFAANVNATILDLEERSEPIDDNDESSAHSLLHGFDALLGIFLQLSDELELIVIFSGSKNKKDEASVAHIGALTAILAFAETFDQLFSDLKPIILNSFKEEPDDYMVVLFERLDCLVDLLCETTHRVGERQEWNSRSETTYVTLLEMIERDSLDLRCYFDDVSTPDPGISANVYEAWSATGHTEELKALQRNDDPQMFRHICYEVMVSTDQWCPDTDALMEVCDIDPEMLKEDPLHENIDESELAPIPQAAENILDKINGDTLRRLDVFASILRRILPPRAVTDLSLLIYFTSIRHTLDSPLELSATNIVSISSIPESMNDPDALGVAGVGKTTLAAMVAAHPDVRRYFIDGVVWVYIGDEELNYKRYTQCLRELVAQLDFYDGIPLFAELLHTPGENLSKRKRREEGFMVYARDTIAGLLENRNVLIILDDVCFEPDMDWFDFAPMPDESIQSQRDNCALVVTTRCRSLLPAADTVEIDMLNEADAITLLIQESGQLSHTLMADSLEARSLVKECANHPLAVKSVGRWLNLKHATAGVVNSVEEIHSEVIKSMDRILKTGENTGSDMMYEILSTSLSPAINGGPTNIIKFCFAAFILVFCDRNHISEFLLIEQSPIIPMDIAELLFQTLLEMYEVSLLKKGSLFYAQKKEAAVLIPEALSALGVLKVITYSDNEEEADLDDEQKFLQVMHSIHHEYGEYLANDDPTLKDFTKDAERQWNRALVDAYLSRVREWDWGIEEAAHSYALEMIVSHMIRGSMYNVAASLLSEKSFIRGRLRSLGRENCTRRHIKDCEMLCRKLRERKSRDKKLKPIKVMKNAYQALGRELTINVEKNAEHLRVKNVEVARAHYEIGFSLAENRCWDAAIVHWDRSQDLLMSVLGSVEVVAGILYNIGVVYMELNEYELALGVLKKCLKIRWSIHGEGHVLYAQTIQKIGDVFLNMSDYHEAFESYNWALDVMYKEPDHHFIQIGEILDNKGTIHYSKGEVDEALQCHQKGLRSKQEDLGEDHPELASTYQHIGNCLSDQGNIDDAIVHFEEAIRLKELDPEGGPESDADVLTIEGVLHNLEGNQDQGLECYERSLQILVTKVPYRKEKIASLLHLIGCVYLMSGEQKKAMKLFQECLQARRKVLGFVHLDVASTLFNMAFLHQTRNHLEKALRCLEEALKIRQLRLPKSEKVAVTHEKIGSLARGIGKAKKAQIAFEEALVIRKAIHGEQHEAVAAVLQELGELMDDFGEYETAMSHFIEALEIRRHRLGADDISVAESLYSMGFTLHNNNESDRALVCLIEALSIRRFQLGEDSVEVGDTLNMMGFLKAKRGQLDDALTLLWDALRIRKLQEDHIKVSETLKNIGNVHREKEEFELALECYAESLRIRRAELGSDHEKVADVLVGMGGANVQLKRDDEAKELYEEALTIRTNSFGEHDDSVAVVLQHLGMIEFRASNLNKARGLLSRSLAIRRDNGTNHDVEFVNILLTMGNIYKQLEDGNNETEARVFWTEAYHVFHEDGLAKTNPQIAEVIQHLDDEGKIDERTDANSEMEVQTKKSFLLGIVTEKFKREKSEGGIYQKGRKRRTGKGFKL